MLVYFPTEIGVLIIVFSSNTYSSKILKNLNSPSLEKYSLPKKHLKNIPLLVCVRVFFLLCMIGH